MIVIRNVFNLEFGKAREAVAVRRQMTLSMRAGPPQ
jgi:hypothetical protein